MASRKEGEVWLKFSLMAMALWGLWGVLSKVATRHLPPQGVYLLTITGHLVVMTYVLSQGFPITWHPVGVAAALSAGLCMAFGLLTFFFALARGEAAVVVPVTALYPVVTVILSLALLQESFTLRRAAGVVLAVVAVWLLSK
ncbi:MAG: DMT family transporter [Deltaproteobacteria bacterium]|nr:DMT family transporter [Deltaproteobacteria bacterium]